MAEAEETTTSAPEDTTTEETLSKMINDATGYNSYMYSGENNTGTMYCYLTQDAEYTTGHDYYDNGHATLLCVGAAGGDGSLTVTGNDTEVNVGASLYVGGRGYGQDASQPAHNGYVFVGTGATLNVGAHPGNYGIDLTQLHVGSPEGVSGKMVVEGTVNSHGQIVVSGGLSDAAGLIQVQKGGKLALHVPDNIKSGSPQVIIGHTANSSGSIVVDEQSTFEITTTETRQCDVTTWIGSSGDGSLVVKNGSTADLTTGYGSNIVYVGVSAGATGTISVDSSALTVGESYVGYAGEGKVTLSSEAEATFSGATNIGYDTGSGSLSVDSGSSATFEKYVMVGGWNGGSGDLSVSNGGTADMESELYLGYGAGSSGNVTVAGDASQLAVSGTSYVGHSGEGTVTISEGADVTAGGALYLGYKAGSSGDVTVAGDTSQLAVSGATIVGYSGEGAMTISEGADVMAGGELYIGGLDSSTGTVTVDGAGSNLTVTNMTFLGYAEVADASKQNSGTLELKNGASADLQYVQATGTSTVSITGGSKATVGNGLNGLYIGDTAQLIVEDAQPAGEEEQGAKSSLQVNGTLSNKGILSADLSQGGSVTATMVENSGTMDVTLAKGASFDPGFSVTNTSTGIMNVNVSDSESSYETFVFLNEGKANVTVANGGTVSLGAVENSGTLDVKINEGGTYTADSVENSSGTMTVTVDAGSSYEVTTVENAGTMAVELKKGARMVVGTYVNEGDSTITAAEETVCEIAKLDLSGGSMTMDGDGSFNLGGEDAGLSSDFSVTGATETTHIDISALGGSAQNVSFTINSESVFTLNFRPEALVDVKEGMEKSFTLTLIVGYEGFSVDGNTLVALLEKSVYNFETAVAMALAVETDVKAGAVAYEVENAEYRMEGSNLVWTGTVKGIPEPTTATLSLLALAALAARRRRARVCSQVSARCAG